MNVIVWHSNVYFMNNFFRKTRNNFFYKNGYFN